MYVVIVVVEVSLFVFDDFGVWDGFRLDFMLVVYVDYILDVVSVMVSCGGVKGVEVFEVVWIKN